MTERNTTREGTNTPADKVNETAAPQDIVTPRAFEGRVKKFDPTEDARCSFDDKAPPPAEKKRLQEMADEEEARAECYRLAQ
jgi:hypothetical protein